MRNAVISSLAVVLVASIWCSPTAGQQVRVVRGKWVWDATGRTPPIAGGVVVIRGDRIVAVGAERDIKIPTDAEIIDQRELFLMPGLVNSHDHLAMDQFSHMTEGAQKALPAGLLAFKAARNGRNALLSGVTTTRIMTEVRKGDSEFMDIEYRNAFDEGLVPGPRLVVAGYQLRPPEAFPNYPGLEPPVSGVDDVVRAVRQSIGAGADFCKMYLSGVGFDVPGIPNTSKSAIYFTKSEIEAIVQECKRHGMKVGAHCPAGGPSLDIAMDAGVDYIDHGFLFTRNDMEAIKAHNIILSIGGVRWFTPGGEAEGYVGIPPPPNGEEMVRKWYTLAFEVRPKLAVGTDGFQEVGAMGKEVGFLVKYGLPKEEALLAATRNGGDLTGLPVGTLEANKYADIIGLQGNPLQDIGSLQQVKFVMKGGKIFNLSGLWK